LPLLAVCLLLSRAALVICLGDVFGYGEEFEKGAVARLLRADTGLSWRDLPYHPYEGGGFVQGLLDALAFACLGPSVLALKTTALLWNLAILWAGFRWLERDFGRLTARIFGAVLIAAPLSFQKLSTLALGIHVEATLFLLLLLGQGLRLVREPGGQAWRWTLLGATGGLACFFSYQCVLALASVGGGLLFARRWPAPRCLAALVLGFLLGLAPWLAMLQHWGSKLFDVHGEALEATGDWSAVLASARSIWTGRSLLDALALGLGAAALPGLAALAAARGALDTPARRAATWLLVYASLFAAAYMGAGFAVGKIHHYVWLARLAPFWMAGSLALAIGLGWAISAAKGPQRWLGILGLCLWIAAGLAGTLRECAAGRPGRPIENLALLAKTRGYAWDGYLMKLWPRLAMPDAEKLARLRRAADGDEALLEDALAQAWSRHGTRSHADVAAARGDHPAEFTRGLGSWLRQNGGRTLQARLTLAEAAAPHLSPWLQEAVGRFGVGLLAKTEHLAEELSSGLKQQAHGRFFVGHGWRLYLGIEVTLGPYWEASHRRLRFAPHRLERLVADLPAEERPLIEKGLAEAKRAHELP
jgi:hypothetical protein